MIKDTSRGDYWDESRLNKLFDRWILREWRINLEKDKNKGEGKPGDYRKLGTEWKKHQKDNPDTIINFWLKTNPFYTIPPYQDNNNRRPPHCQSLILNPTYLDSHYPEWQDWLRELEKLPVVKEYLGDYKEELKKLKSSRDKFYFNEKTTGSLKTDSGRRTNKDLNSRILQFVFDRAKATDLLRLNEIYSQTKKYRQHQSTAEEKKSRENKPRKKLFKDSKLPDKSALKLKTPRNYQNDALFDQGSFLHLVCNYYKLRQKARDGRIFIHPEYRFVKGRGYENTGRFDHTKHLLTYCNHKPRQKRYQSFYDLAGVLQVSPEHLQKTIGSRSDDALLAWLKSFRGLAKLCQKSADAQKNHRGMLKVYIEKARQDKKSELYKLNQSIEKTAHEIGRKLFSEDDKEFEQKTEKFRSVFSFTQINNIAFKQRSGNAKTCARMQRGQCSAYADGSSEQ